MGEMLNEGFSGASAEGIRMLEPPRGFVARGGEGHQGHLREPILDSYDWILINTSAGKDSQQMMEEVVDRAKKARVFDRLIAVHCDLGSAEWEGCRELAEEQAAHYGLTGEKFQVVKKEEKGTGRLIDFLERTMNGFKSRGPRVVPWPDSANRWCTSELKTAAVDKLMTRLLKPGGTRFLNCLGIRGQESGMRARCQFCKGIEDPRKLKGKAAQAYAEGKGTWRRMSQCWVCGGSGERAHMHPALDGYGLDRRKQIRQEDRWYPIHAMSEDTVWRRIAASKVPHHPAYDIGMPRLSCVFCIYGSKAILTLAGHYNRELLARYVEVEKKVGYTFTQATSLAEIQKAVESSTIEEARQAVFDSIKKGEQCGPGD
jgi:3'-phosphoadenosine 5'-phosphosulfate sulfotransferase (PAPS reductase)/FAD synthetase